MRYFFFLIPLWFSACSDSMNSGLKDACDDLFGSEYFDCISGKGQGGSGPNQDSLTADAAALQVAAGTMANELTGLIYNIKMKSENSCLTHSNGAWSWQACETYSLNQQFHFDDRVNIKFTLDQNGGSPAVLDGTAFRIQTRESANKFLNLSECAAGQNPETDGCVVMEASDTSLREKGKSLLRCLSLDQGGRPFTTDCSQAVYFMDIPNNYGENYAIFDDYVYSGLIALMDKTKELDSLGIPALETPMPTPPPAGAETTPEEQEANEVSVELDACDPIVAEILGEPCDTALTSSWSADTGSMRLLQATDVPKYLDLVSDFSRLDRCESFRLLAKDGTALAGQCPSADGIGSDQIRNSASWVILDACATSPNAAAGQCVNDSPIKKLYDHFTELDQGAVIQVMKASQTDDCIQQFNEDGAVKLRYVNCKEGENDDPSTQFRVAKVSTRSNGENIIQLRTLKDQEKCADITNMQIVSCKDVGSNRYFTDGLTNDMRPEGVENQFFKFHHCSIASNHKDNNFYDCYYKEPEHLKRWSQLGFGLAFLALAALPLALFGVPAIIVGAAAVVLTVPSYVFDGMVCASGDPVVSQGACLSLGLGIGIDLATFNVGGSAPSAAFKQATMKRMLRKQINSSAGKALLYSAKKLIKMGAFAPEHAASAFDNMVIQNVLARKYDRAQLKEMLSLLRQKLPGPGCGNMSCNHPMVPFPRAQEADEYIDGELMGALADSKMDDVKRSHVKTLLSRDATPEQIENARQGL